MNMDGIMGKCKEIIKNALGKLSGSKKRKLAAEIALEYGYGGQSYVAKELNMGRDTIRKGMREIETRVEIEDAFKTRGRKPITEKMPNLEKDIREIADMHSQIYPKFQSIRLYTRLTAASLRENLKKYKGYSEEELPTNQTLTNVLNKLGYTLSKVKKAKPIEKINETDAIFDNLKKFHEEISDNDKAVRLSIDAKDRVKIGEFSRDGKSRVEVKAVDHDFADTYITPFGIMDVKEKTVELSMTEGKVTADFIADRIEECWFGKYANGKKEVLVINADNGPENNSRRTQFIKRMVDFSIKANITIFLAYYPPYHSKYNPIERFWGGLEQHWNGELLDSREAVIKFAETMKYDGKHPNVSLIEEKYNTGVKLTKKAMDVYETVLERMEGIKKWFVKIVPSNCKKIYSLTVCST